MGRDRKTIAIWAVILVALAILIPAAGWLVWRNFPKIRSSADLEAHAAFYSQDHARADEITFISHSKGTWVTWHADGRVLIDGDEIESIPGAIAQVKQTLELVDVVEPEELDPPRFDGG